MEKSLSPPPYVADGGEQSRHMQMPMPNQGYPPPPGSFPAPPGSYPPPPGSYPPLPQAYPQPPPPGQTTVIVGAPQISGAVLLGGGNYGPSSQNAYCPHCQSQILTRIEVTTATKTHVYALILCLFGCWPCVCIPYCVDSCKNKNHHCPNCSAYLGSYYH